MAECVGGLCIATRCSARMSARTLVSVFSHGTNVPP